MSDPIDDTDSNLPAIERLDLDRVYANYLRTCGLSGVDPVSRERALGLLQEWGVLSDRLAPTTH